MERNPPWSPEEIEILTQANMAGKNDIEVSELLSIRTRGAVCRKRQELRLRCNPVPYVLSKYPPDVWTPAEIRVAASMRRAGQTDAEIGRSLKRTEGAVRQKMHLLGMPRIGVKPVHIERPIIAPPPEDYRFDDVPAQELARRDAGRAGRRVIGPWPVQARSFNGSAASMCAES